MQDTLTKLKRELPYPKIHPSFTAVEVSPNEVQFRVGPWSGPAFTVRDDDGDGEVRQLVESLDGETPVEAIVESFDESQRADVVGIVDALSTKGVVRSGEATPDSLDRYSTVRSSLGADDVRAVRESDVLVVGDGRIADLVRSNLDAMDVEPVATTPVERDVLAETVPEADLVVAAVDEPRPDALAELNRLADDAGTPWTVGQLFGFDALVGPTVFPGETACYECFVERTFSNVAFDSRAAYRRARENATAMAIPALAQVVAGFLTCDVVHLLAGGTGFNAGSVVHVDFVDFGVESNEVLKIPRCDACGTDGEEYQRFVTIDQLVSEHDGAGR